MYTTSLSIRRAFLVNPLNPTDDPIICGTQRQQDSTLARDGEVRQFAGNRQQLITRTNDLRTIPITFRLLTYAQMKRIEGWRGTVLLLRTLQGDRVFGGYLEVSVKPMLGTTVDAYGRAFDASVIFYETTYDESV